MTHDRQPANHLAGITGVILAGGRSSRMGKDKAALVLDGRPLIARVVERLRQALDSAFIVGAEDLAALQPGAPIIPDERPGLGPLGGMATALAAAHTEWIFLVACDMPFIQPALVRHMAAIALAAPQAQAVALRSPGGLEPLHAAYRRDIAPIVAQALRAPHPSMRGLLGRLRVIEIAPEEAARFDPRGLSTFNANTEEEWRRALVLASEGASE
jgi:molybdenum cofactor guanylyltransferase